MSEESIKVAVRVRPFNQREKDRNAKLIIQMHGQSTLISDPQIPHDEGKQFSFDHSYWSHDDFIENSSGILEAKGSSSIYASQQKVFDDLGRDVLQNAFDGFNCSLFAYGQTGSGKSYSMIGYGANRGIVPIACDELFRRIQEAKTSSTRFEVNLSMLEIYNEQVRDLLTKEFPKGGLNVRQHPTSGSFYAEGLRILPVDSYVDIEHRIAEGTQNRTIAATNMNATSSRAHTVVTIRFDQISKMDHGETKKTSVINLVDLAGSERAASTGATGDRLKESANINRSLSALGNVIAALADLSSGTKRKIVVPYRDSILTKLLQNALGGNSKTVMIAALSPADVNFDETLSTLRFADRVKRIKNTVIVNENPIEKLIRGLKEENERLKLLIDSGKYNLQLDVRPDMSHQDVESLRKELEEEILSQIRINQQILQDSKTPWEMKLKQARSDDSTSSIVSKPSRPDKTLPHLANLNEDPMLSYVICHYLTTDETIIGSNRNSTICLNGLSILEQHAAIRYTSSHKYELKQSEPGAKIKLNGYNLNGTTLLGHKDRLLFGASHMYVFLDPTSQKDLPSDIPDVITWEFAQKEIAKAKGYSMGSNLTSEQEDTQEKVLSLLPTLSEVNAISEELNKYRTFEIVIMPISSWVGVLVKGSRVMIKMRNLLNQNVWYWDDVKFMNRSFIIKEHYQKFLDGDEEILYISKEDDPFWEPIEDVLIGTANVFLQSLAYSLDFDDEICIVDYKGMEQGRLGINLSPCSANGKVLNEEQFVDQPEELLNKPYSFKISMRHLELMDERYNKGLRIRYKIFNELEFTQTNVIGRQSVCVNVRQSRIVTIPNIDHNWLNFFDNGCIIFQIYALQEEGKLDNHLLKMTTRELRQIEHKQDTANIAPVNHANTSLPGDPKLKAELTLLQRKYNRLEQKEKRIQQLCRDWESSNDYVKFYKLLSAIAFSSGTKLKSTARAVKKEDMVDIYVFGADEQEYIKDIEESNVERQKHWDEYYRKMTLKQRRGSLAFRSSLKRTPNDFLSSSINSGMELSPPNIDLGSRSSIDSRPLTLDTIAHPVRKQSPNDRKHLQNGLHNDETLSPYENETFPVRSGSIFKTGGDNGHARTNSAKNSTTCTLQ